MGNRCDYKRVKKKRFISFLKLMREERKVLLISESNKKEGRMHLLNIGKECECE